MRLTRRLLVACVALVPLNAAARAADDAAAEPVRKLYAKVEEALKSGQSDLTARVNLVGPTFDEVFDLPAMLRVAVGTKWKGLKPEQQTELNAAFDDYFTTLYAKRLGQAAGGKFEIKPGSEARGANQIVRTTATTKDGEESDVDYVVTPARKIQDVLLNGNVSEVAALRGGFADPLKKGPDELVKFLRERTEGMLAAKPKP